MHCAIAYLLAEKCFVGMHFFHLSHKQTHTQTSHPHALNTPLDIRSVATITILSPGPSSGIADKKVFIDSWRKLSRTASWYTSTCVCLCYGVCVMVFECVRIACVCVHCMYVCVMRCVCG